MKYEVTGWVPYDRFGKLEDLSIEVFQEKDIKKKEKMIEMLRAFDDVVEKYCIDNLICYTDSEHQSSEYKCVPVINNKYVNTYTLRAWSGLMARVWSKILGENFDYLDFYCQDIPEEVESFLKGQGAWSEKPPRA